MGNFIQAIGAAFNLNDMFMNFPLKKLKITNDKCELINGDRHRDILAKLIFKENVKMVVNDIIENNVTFKFPNVKAELSMMRFYGDDFKTLRQKGAFKNVDFLKSMFSGYRLVLKMFSKFRPTRIKNVYVNKYFKDKITQYTNEGKQYC